MVVIETTKNNPILSSASSCWRTCRARVTNSLQAFLRIQSHHIIIPEMRLLALLMALLGVLRVYGGFPYTWSFAPPRLTKRRPLVYLSVLFGFIAVTAVVSEAVLYESDYNFIREETSRTTIIIMNRTKQLTLFFLIGHCVCRSHLLADMLFGLYRLPSEQRQALTKTDLAMSSATMATALFHHASGIYIRAIVNKSYTTNVRMIFSISFEAVIGTLIFIVPLILFLTIRVLSSSLEDRVSMSPFFETAPRNDSKHSILKIEDKHDGHSNVECKTRSCSSLSRVLQEPFVLTPRSINIADLKDFTTFIFRYNVILEKAIEYMQLPVVILLLNEFVSLAVLVFLVVSGVEEDWSFVLGTLFALGSLLRASLVIYAPADLVSTVSR